MSAKSSRTTRPNNGLAMAKSNFPPEGDVRLTLNVRKEIHQKLKVASVMASTTMG